MLRSASHGALEERIHKHHAELRDVTALRAQQLYLKLVKRIPAYGAEVMDVEVGKGRVGGALRPLPMPLPTCSSSHRLHGRLCCKTGARIA